MCLSEREDTVVPTVFIVDAEPGTARTRDLVQTLGLNCRDLATVAEMAVAIPPDRPGCAIANLSLEAIDGSELLDQLAGLDVPVPIILTGEHRGLSGALHAMQNGDIIVLESPWHPEQLTAAIRDALARNAASRAALQERAALRNRFDRLTPREREAMWLIVQGLPNKTIARRLHSSERTSARIRATVFDKMQAGSATELALMSFHLRSVGPGECDVAAAPVAEAEARACSTPRISRREGLGLDERQLQLIAYDLHDGPAQYLAAALTHLQTYRQSLADNPQRAGESWERGLGLLNRCMTDLRRLMGGLQPAHQGDGDLVDAVQELIRMCRSEYGLEVEFYHDVPCVRLTPSMESNLFRIIEESLRNLWRHSRSTRCRITLAQRDRSIWVEIRDWGIGGARPRTDQGHFGLAGIEQRARLFGGRATIQSKRGVGTRIAVELPLVISQSG